VARHAGVKDLAYPLRRVESLAPRSALEDSEIAGGPGRRRARAPAHDLNASTRRSSRLSRRSPACSTPGPAVPPARARPGGPDAPPPPPAATTARPPLRDAAGDAALRVMLAELASRKACSLIQGQFRPLRDPQRHDVVTGTLWIRSCQITNRGAHVT